MAGGSGPRPARAGRTVRRPGTARSAMAAPRAAQGDGPQAHTRLRTDEGPSPTAPLCAFALCPICATLTALGDARPDLVEHMLVASRELLLAVRALIDARLEGTRPADPRQKVERLTII